MPIASEVPSAALSQNSTLTCSCVIRGDCTVAADSPTSVKIPTNPVKTVTIATSPKSAGASSLASTAIDASRTAVRTP